MDDYGPTTARYYDAAYATLESLGDDVEFYRGLARETGGPVLEVGCGTGRVLGAIAADGLACTGLDRSPSMLDVLARRHPDVTRVVGDMTSFDLGGERFALVFSAFRAFQHLLSVEDQLRCLERLRAHLAPGGAVAFDVFNPRPDLGANVDEPESADLRFEQEGERVVRYARVSRDPGEQTLRVRFRYERSVDGAVVGEDTTEFSMRWFHRFELLHLLGRSGFESVRLYGDFDRSPVRTGSPALIAVARTG